MRCEPMRGFYMRMRLRLFFAILMIVHRVLLNFQLYKDTWRVAFLEADCKTSLHLKLHFKYTEKIKEMYRRNAETRLQEDEQALEHGLEIGRGGNSWLRLNEEQYQTLRRPS